MLYGNGKRIGLRVLAYRIVQKRPASDMDKETVKGQPQASASLRCASCHREMAVSKDEISSYATTGRWPRCCSEIMCLEVRPNPEP